MIVNKLLGKVVIQLVGIGEGGGTFHAPFNNISSEMPTSVSLDWKQMKGNQVEVPIKSLDEICIPRFIGKKMCIKIDVEGTEVDIFLHGRETMKIIKPDIICEVLHGASQFDIYDKILDEYSYSKFLITDEGFKRFDQIKPNIRFKDWFFTTKSNFKI